MALLAYDPDRVSRLRRELADAADDLRRVTCTDPAAADSMRVVRAAVAQLDATWLPLVTRLLATDPLSGGQRRGAQITALDQSLICVMADGYGWSVQLDPLMDNAAMVTVEEARALAATLNGIDPMALANHPDQLAWLAQQLAVIGHDPSLSVEFLANFHNWDVLPYVLAEQRAYSYDSEYTGNTLAADLDPVFDGLMSIWRHAVPTNALHAGTGAEISTLLPPMDDPDPYAQALLLRSLHLDPIALATVTDELLRTWLDNKEQFGGGSRDLAVALGTNVADLLLDGIAGNASASAYFLSLIGNRPALLFQTLDDPDIAYRLALAGTDPAHTTAGAAEGSVLAILDYFRANPYETAQSTDGYAGDYGPFLGRLVTPWLLQFTASNREWGTDPAIKTRLLAVALADDRALRVLTEASQRITDGFAHSLATNDEETIALSQQVGGLLNLLGQLVINEHIDDENEQSQFVWDLTWAVLAAATNFLPGGPVANVAAGVGVQTLEGLLAPYVVGPDADEVRRTGEYAMDVTLTVAASMMVSAQFRTWQADGRIAEDAPPPPPPPLPTDDRNCPSSGYRPAIEEWASNLPGGMSGALGGSALNLVSSFIGSGQANEHCAELGR